MKEYIELKNPQELHNTFKKVYLNNIINECVLRSKDNHLYVQAIDMSNSIFLTCKSKQTTFPKGEFGINNISLLIKFLDSLADTKIQICYDVKHNTILFKRGKNELKYMLSAIDTIPTNVDVKKSPIKNVKSKMKYSLEITEKIKKDLNFYISLTSIKVIALTILPGTSSVILKAGNSVEHQFSVNAGKINTEIKNGVNVLMNSEYLNSIMNVLTWEKEKEIPFLEFTDEKQPVLINQNKDNIWALSPIAI